MAPLAPNSPDPTAIRLAIAAPSSTRSAWSRLGSSRVASAFRQLRVEPPYGGPRPAAVAERQDVPPGQRGPCGPRPPVRRPHPRRRPRPTTRAASSGRTWMTGRRPGGPWLTGGMALQVTLLSVLRAWPGGRGPPAAGRAVGLIGAARGEYAPVMGGRAVPGDGSRGRGDGADPDRRRYLAIADSVGYSLRACGYHVDVVVSGETVLESGPGSYDLLILDVMLPGLSGVEVCRRVRERSAVPVLMLTALDGEADRWSALRPAPMITWASRSRWPRWSAGSGHLRRRGWTGSRTRSAGRRPVPGPGRATARIGGRTIELTPLEFRVLAMLAADRAGVHPAGDRAAACPRCRGR